LRKQCCRVALAGKALVHLVPSHVGIVGIMSAAEAAELGMLCGGNLNLLPI